jgi:1-acyl-sn-glycerol-3-phosphate acyltransferase
MKQNVGRLYYAVCAGRSCLFYTILTLTVVSVIVVCWPLIFLSPKIPFFIFSTTANISILLMRLIVGIRIKFEGVEILRRLQRDFGCFLLAPKHQSELETLVFSIFFKAFRIVFKREMRNIPVIGSYMKRMKFIEIDRSAGRSAVQHLLTEGQLAIKMNRPILIFPEGTRTPFGGRGKYHPGVAIMYDAMKVPILPVSHNSGKFFPAHSFVKFPGVITFKFLDPIMPGLSTREALQELETRIEAGCHTVT